MTNDNPLRPTITLWVLLGAFAFLMASLVVSAVRRPAMPTGELTAPHPEPVADSLVGPAVYTVDASDPDRWAFFDFSRNAVVADPGPLDWDLAFRRFHVVANGGAGFAGRGGIADLGPLPLDSVALLPDTGYLPSRRDSTNPAIQRWYDYGYTSHLLQPKGHAYAVRTADGKYALLAIQSYYCTGVQPGCLTFRYWYQGDGSRRLRPARADSAAGGRGAAP